MTVVFPHLLLQPETPGQWPPESLREWPSGNTAWVTKEMLERASGFVTALPSGQIAFDGPAAIAAGINGIDANILQRGVEILNNGIDAGYLEVMPGSGGKFLNPIGPYSGYAKITITWTVGTATYSVTIDQHWYGTTFHLNKALSQKIHDLLVDGAVAAGAITALLVAGGVSAPAAIISLIVTALLALGALAFTACEWCNGVDLLVLPTGTVIPLPG